MPSTPNAEMNRNNRKILHWEAWTYDLWVWCDGIRYSFSWHLGVGIFRTFDDCARGVFISNHSSPKSFHLLDIIHVRGVLEHGTENIFLYYSLGIRHENLKSVYIIVIIITALNSVNRLIRVEYCIYTVCFFIIELSQRHLWLSQII